MRRSTSRSRSLHRALSNSSASTAASGVSSSRCSRFHEGTLRADSYTSASTAASASRCVSKRKRSACRSGSRSRRSSEEAQDLSGVHGEEGGHTRTEPGSSAAQQLAQQHFWQHKSKYEGRLRAEEEEKARLLKKDPLHFARRATETDGLGYGIEHVDAHVMETLEIKRKQEDSLPDINARGRSGNGTSLLVEGWLSFVEKEEAAKKIQVAWRRSWRQRHGIPSPRPSDSSSSSDNEVEPPVRMKDKRRSSTTNTRVLAQHRRSSTTGDRARRGSTAGEARKSTKSGGDSVLPGQKSSLLDKFLLGSSRLKEPSKSTDISKIPGPLRNGTQTRRSSMPGTLRSSPSQPGGAATANRAQQQQRHHQHQYQQQQQQQQGQQQWQQQEGEQLQWQDSEDRAALTAQAVRSEAWQEASQQSGSNGHAVDWGRPVSGGRATLSLTVPDEGMLTAFSSAHAQHSPDSFSDVGSPPMFSDRQQVLPVQATASHHKHAAAATTAGVECNHGGGGEEGHAAGDAPPPASDNDLLAELAPQQGRVRRRPPPKAHSFHLVMGEKGGQPWGYMLRAHPQPVQRPVSRLAVESNTTTPLLPRGKSALSLLAVQGSKPPHPTSSPHSPSHPQAPPARSLPQLHTSFSLPMGGADAATTSASTTPTHTNTPFPTTNSTQHFLPPFFDVPGSSLEPIAPPIAQPTARPSTASAPRSAHSMQHGSSRPCSPFEPIAPLIAQPTARPSTASILHSVHNAHSAHSTHNMPGTQHAGSSPPHQLHAPQLHAHTHRQSLPGLGLGGGVEGKEHGPPKRSKSLGVINAGLQMHVPKPPVGSPSAEQSFLGRMLEHKLRNKAHKQMPSLSSSPSSSIDGMEPAALSLGLQGRRFSPMASRCVSSSELDALPFDDDSRRQSSSSLNLDNGSSLEMGMPATTPSLQLPSSKPSRPLSALKRSSTGGEVKGVGGQAVGALGQLGVGGQAVGALGQLGVGGQAVGALGQLGVGGQAAGAPGQLAGAVGPVTGAGCLPLSPTKGRVRRRVSFIDLTGHTGPADNSPAAESQSLTMLPQPARSSAPNTSMGKSPSGSSNSSIHAALQHTSNRGASSSRALQPTRITTGVVAGTAVVAAVAAVAETEAAVAAVLGSRAE